MVVVGEVSRGPDIHGETEKAVLLEIGEELVWIPKSVILGGYNYLDEYVYIKCWFLDKNNIKYKVYNSFLAYGSNTGR